MKIALTEVTEKMRSVLKEKGFAESDIPFLIEMYLGGELRGHASHGLASFPGFVKQSFDKLPEPEVLKETSAFFMIDAKSNPGAVVGKRAADEALKRAKKETVGVSLIKNMDSWLRPGAIAQYVADQGFVAIVINNGGEAAVAPPGGYDPVTGTNPIAYGLPTEESSLVVDMATSKRAKGQIRLANKYGTDLPPDTFYDKSGNITRDPKEAISIKAFGGYKGFALALLVEVLCGSLLDMPMMIQTDPSNNTSFGGVTPDRGAFVLVIDPAQISGLSQFKKANSDYINRIKETPALAGEQIRIPGEKAGLEQREKLEEGYLELPDELWKELQEL